MRGKRIQDSPDHWSDIVGLPDEWDFNNLKTLIKNFSRRKFTVEGFTITGAELIKMCRDEAKVSHQLDGANAIHNPYGLKSADSDARVVTSMPQVLNMEIMEAYPTIFRDKKHFEWFIKKFPQFRITSKY